MDCARSWRARLESGRLGTRFAACERLRAAACQVPERCPQPSPAFDAENKLLRPSSAPAPRSRYPRDDLFPGSGKGLVEVVDGENDIALRRREPSEIQQVSIAAGLHD